MNKLVNKPLIFTTFNNAMVASGAQAKVGTEVSWGIKDTEAQTGLNDFVDHLVNLCFDNWQ